MANPESASYEPNSTELPPNYDPVEQVCYDLMDTEDAQDKGKAAIDQAGEADQGGSEHDEEQEDQEMDPEVKKMLDAFTAPGLKKQLTYMLTDGADKYDQHIVAGILNNPGYYNNVKPFTMAERIARYMKEPSLASKDKKHPITEQAKAEFKRVQAAKKKFEGSKYKLIADAKAYEGQDLGAPDLGSWPNAKLIAFLKSEYPEQSYEQCFEEFVGIKINQQVGTAVNQAWSYRQLG